MAGLGEYAGSFASGFGQRMDYWREEDKKLSKQHKDAVDAIYQFARNNPHATQKDLENYASKSGVTDWRNLLGKTGFGDLAADLKRKRGLAQEEIDHTRKTRGRDDTRWTQGQEDRTQRLTDAETTRNNAATTFANQQTTFANQQKVFGQDQQANISNLKIKEHGLFLKEMEERLGGQPFMAESMTDQKMRSIAADAFQELSATHPHMDFSDDRANYDYQSRLQKRAQTRQEKATIAGQFIEKSVADNPNKYSQEGELDKLREEVRKANGFGPEVDLITDQRAGQIISAAAESESARKFEAQTKKQDELRTQLSGRALYWDEAAMVAGPEGALQGKAWQEATAALRVMGIDNPAMQGTYLQSFNPSGMKREAEAKLKSDNAQRVAELAKTHNTVEGLKRSMGWEGYKLSDETNSWLEGQVKAKAQTRRANRENEIIDSIAGGLPNAQNIYHNFMQGDTERFDEWLRQLNETYSGTWGEFKKDEVLIAIQRKLLPGLQADVKAQKDGLIASSGYTDPKVLKSTTKSEILGQGLNNYQSEIIFALIDHAVITDLGSVSQVAQYIRQNEILADAKEGATEVNIWSKAQEVIAQMSQDASINFTKTAEDETKRLAWVKVMTSQDFLDDPDGHIGDLQGDIDGDWFTSIKRDLTNLQKQEDWSISDKVAAIKVLNAKRTILLREIQDEEALLANFGTGLHPDYYKKMQELITKAHGEVVSITQQIVKAEEDNKDASAQITEDSDVGGDTSTFDVDAQLKSIKDKLGELDQYRGTLYDRENLTGFQVSQIARGIDLAESQGSDDKEFLDQLKVTLSNAQPGIPLVQLIGEAELAKLKQIINRDYRSIVDTSVSGN